MTAMEESQAPGLCPGSPHSGAVGLEPRNSRPRATQTAVDYEGGRTGRAASDPPLNHTAPWAPLNPQCASLVQPCWHRRRCRGLPGGLWGPAPQMWSTEDGTGEAWPRPSVRWTVTGAEWERKTVSAARHCVFQSSTVSLISVLYCKWSWLFSHQGAGGNLCPPSSIWRTSDLLVINGMRLCDLQVKAPQLCPTLCHPMDYTVYGMLQARILEWAASTFSKGSSQHRDRTQVSFIAGKFFTSWAMREAPKYWSG